MVVHRVHRVGKEVEYVFHVLHLGYHQVDVSMRELEGDALPGEERNSTFLQVLDLERNHVLPQHPESRREPAIHDAFDISQIAAGATRIDLVIVVGFLIFLIMVFSEPVHLLRVCLEHDLIFLNWLLIDDDQLFSVVAQLQSGFEAPVVLNGLVERVVVLPDINLCLLQPLDSILKLLVLGAIEVIFELVIAVHLLGVHWIVNVPKLGLLFILQHLLGQVLRRVLFGILLNNLAELPLVIQGLASYFGFLQRLAILLDGFAEFNRLLGEARLV